VNDRLTPDALRARVHAAIGEPELSSRGFELPAAVTRRRRFGTRLVPVPAPVRVTALVGLAVAVAAVATVAALVNVRNLPRAAGSPSGPAVSSPPRPTPSASPTLGVVPPVSSAGGFVPVDVTAVSGDEWWVLGSDSSGCAGTGCTRILQTQDGGQTFTAIPTPAAALTGLRFVNPQDGWAFGGATVWSTHDGGGAWNASTLPGTISDLETSGSYVYAAVEGTGSTPLLSLERSPIGSDAWQQLSIPVGVGPGDLNVHGDDVWLSEDVLATGANAVLVSTDDGAHFTQTSSIFPGTVVSLNAANAEDLWALCSTGHTVEIYVSVDAGQSFTQVQTAPVDGVATSANIAGSSATNVVLGGPRLLVSNDGGQSFVVAEDNGDGWVVVGFTNAADGFAFGTPSMSSAGPEGLWRTTDGGGTWSEVQLP
jgi:hypothetical protein